MKAIVVTDEAAGTAGMTLMERPEPEPANDVVVQVHASGFVPTELAWPSTWTDRLDRDRTPSIPGHELAGVVTALGYGTTGFSVGQRVFGLTDWTRDGTLAEYAAIEARNLAPLPGDVDFTVGASLPRGQARDRQARANREVDVARPRREVACLDRHILRQPADAI
jgi:NADPH:quinone reductase-like Zn-dependent oxidoreductase